MDEERRANPREAVALPLLLGNGAVATTSNISASGLSLVWPSTLSLAPGAVFELRLSAARVTLMSQGRVVRQERRNGELHVAIKLVSTHVIPND